MHSMFLFSLNQCRSAHSLRSDGFIRDESSYATPDFGDNNLPATYLADRVFRMFLLHPSVDYGVNILTGNEFHSNVVSQ